MVACAIRNKPYNLQHKVFHVPRFKRVLQRQDFVDDATQGPNVALVVVRLVLTDLRAQIIRRAFRSSIRIKP